MSTMTDEVKKEINEAFFGTGGGRTFKAILMQSGFTLDQDADDVYADISASELATNYGYTQLGMTLSNVQIAAISGGISTVTWNNVVWSASGGVIGPAAGMAIIWDTGDVNTSTIVGYVAFTGGDRSAGAGTDFTVSDIKIKAGN